MIEALVRLTKNPAQTLLALIILGAGLGTVAFCLSLVNGLILRPLPFDTSDRIYAIGYQSEDSGVSQMLGTDYLRLRSALHEVDVVAAYGTDSVYVHRAGEPKRTHATLATDGLLETLGIAPVMGRAFSADDDRPGAAPVALVTHHAWQRDYDGRNVVGESIVVNGQATTVIGILPPDFAFPYDSEILLPARLDDTSHRDMMMVALARPGATVEQMRSIVDSAQASVGTTLDGVRAGRTLTVKPISYVFVDEATRTYILIMLFASGLVLAIACANVANLQLMQAMGRQQEMAIRSALGASRGVLMRDVLIESMLLSVAATAIALVVANAAGDLIVRVFADNGEPPPYFIHFGMDLRLLGMTALVAVMATGLAGLWPALKATRFDLVSLLHEGSKGSSAGWSRTAASMVIVGVALTTVLLSGAAASLLGLGGLAKAEVGTNESPETILTGTLELHQSQFPDNTSRAQFLLRLAERLRAEPAIESATVSTTLPGAVLGSHEHIGARGAARPDGGYARAQTGAIDKGFLDTYGIPVRDGRDLSRFVSQGQMDVALVDTTTAELLWPGRSPIGQTLLLNPDRPTPDAVTVVGIVDPLQLDSVLAPRLPTVLVPIERFPRSTAVVSVRTRGAAGAIEARMAEAVKQESSQVQLDEVATQADAIARARLGAIVLTRTFTALGVVALLLAIGGLYAIVSLSVARRGRQIGIVRALGAEARDVAALVLGPTGRHVLIGLVLGSTLALPLSRLLAEPGTPLVVSFLTVLAVSVLIALVGAASTLLPLHRALRIDPIVAMQQE